MDKYELVLDIIEHPHNYTSQELETLLEDSETREIYNILCMTDSALETHKEVDVEAEWQAFSKKSGFFRRRFLMRGGRAASIIAIICTSIVAMAVGIAVTVAVKEHNKEVRQEEKAVVSSVPTVTAIEEVTSIPEVSENRETEGSAILFEDEPLSVIMETVCSAYNVEAKFGNEEVAGLHLYYKFDPSLELDEVLTQLNTFESINITKEGNILTID